MEIDTYTRKVLQGGKSVQLTQTELALLLYLLDNVGHIATRAELLEQVWGTTAPVHTRTVDIHISHLRRKLGQQVEITSVMRKGYTIKTSPL